MENKATLEIYTCLFFLPSRLTCFVYVSLHDVKSFVAYDVLYPAGVLLSGLFVHPEALEKLGEHDVPFIDLLCDPASGVCQSDVSQAVDLNVVRS